MTSSGEAVAWFITFQFLRGRDFRQVLKTVTDYGAKLHLVTETQLRTLLAEYPGPAPTDEEIAATVAMASDPAAYTVQPTRNMAVGTMVETAPDLLPYIGGRRWQLIRYPQPVLLTSDAPVAFWSRQPPPLPFGVGLEEEKRRYRTWPI